FTGDMFGLSYRQFDVAGRSSIIPTTTPTQFDPEAMRASIERLLALQPPALYLTHFGQITGIERLGADLLRQLDEHVAVALAARDTPPEQRHGAIRAGLTGLYLAEARRQGWPLAEPELLAWLETDIDLSAQGLDYWLNSLPPRA
ncbi:MAG TPA: MBL fold metallo-hydrolase, partial [Rhodocyclaceae bacterium]|nr:MBL fold metallo-hydrolase [Rhodocyclaceae bacterium]